MKAVYDLQYVEFVGRLRSARKARGFTQGDLAELLNKPQSYISKVETCERRIDVIEAARWCSTLDVVLQDLLPSSVAAPKAPKR
jgi:transcriptional regulator with XRE-family HTH domain